MDECEFSRNHSGMATTQGRWCVKQVVATPTGESALTACVCVRACARACGCVCVDLRVELHHQNRRVRAGWVQAIGSQLVAARASHLLDREPTFWRTHVLAVGSPSKRGPVGEPTAKIRRDQDEPSGPRRGSDTLNGGGRSHIVRVKGRDTQSSFESSHQH